MALHPDFPQSPYAELLPDYRWFPAAEELRSTAYEKLLLPPLVAKIRNEVSAWRSTGYAGASDTSRALLNWWFEAEHLVEQADGDLSNYITDFFVKTTGGTVWLVETKGREERDLPQKMHRLRQWCADVTNAELLECGGLPPLSEPELAQSTQSGSKLPHSKATAYRFVYVDQQGYERNPPKTFASLAAGFTEYQEATQ